MGDMVQNYAFNMCVKYFQTFVEFFEELGHMDTDKVKDMLSSENLSEEEVERLKSIYQDKWQEVPVPVEYCLKVLGKILEDFKDEDNLLMWQEPEMIVMGNPNLLGAMNVRAETVGDYAEDGIKDLAKFMVDFGTKSSSEEE
jgi:hypothetical protein